MLLLKDNSIAQIDVLSLSKRMYGKTLELGVLLCICM